jgi:hypothetical protein
MILAVVSLWALAQVAASSDVELQYAPAVNRVIRRWSSNVIPIPANEPDPLKVTITLSFISIRNVDKDRNQVDVVFWLGTGWQNKALAWDVNEPGFNVTSVNVDYYRIWRPDITIYNGITKPEVLSPRLAIVSNDGSVYYVDSIRSGVTCELQGVDTEHGANCTIKLGSWTYSGATLTISDESSANLDEYVPNPKYKIVSTSHTNSRIFYTCCPGAPFEDFSFSFGIKSQGPGGLVVGLF